MNPQSPATPVRYTLIAAAVAFGLGITTSANAAGKAPAPQAHSDSVRVVSDIWITTKVKSDILGDSVSKGFHVSVATTHGVVVLKGLLANQDAIDHVRDIVEKVDGVKSVDTSGLTVTVAKAS